MICPRGSEVGESSHTVKSLTCALGWCGKVTPNDLPITVQKHEATGGRLRVLIFDKDMNLLEKRG